jgi:hypothetical protein
MIRDEQGRFKKGWLARLVGWPEAPQPEPAPPAPTGPVRGDAAFHVRRFTLALQQCEKGPERRAELQGWLDYWTAKQAAEAINPEAA